MKKDDFFRLLLISLSSVFFPFVVSANAIIGPAFFGSYAILCFINALMETATSYCYAFFMDLPRKRLLISVLLINLFFYPVFIVMFFLSDAAFFLPSFPLKFFLAELLVVAAEGFFIYQENKKIIRPLQAIILSLINNTFTVIMGLIIARTMLLGLVSHIIETIYRWF